MESHCNTCGGVQEVDFVEEGGKVVYCLACGEEFELPAQTAEADDDKYAHYKIARVVKVAPVAKSKDLKLCHVDVIGNADEEKLIPIVTNAKYIEAGWLVVVACEEAVVPAGALVGEDADAVKIAKRSVNGVESRGMLCDAPALRWTGGAKGIVQQLPETFVVGDRPPTARPRA